MESIIIALGGRKKRVLIVVSVSDFLLPISSTVCERECDYTA